LLFGQVKSSDEILAEIDAITSDDIRRVAQRLLMSSPVLAGIGPAKAEAWMDEEQLAKAFAA